VIGHCQAVQQNPEQWTDDPNYAGHQGAALLRLTDAYRCTPGASDRTLAMGTCDEMLKPGSETRWLREHNFVLH
jgi:hypothetical protein